MQRIILAVITLSLLSCGQQKDNGVNATSNTEDTPTTKKSNTYKVQKGESMPNETTDSIFFVGGEKYKVTYKIFSKGEYIIADTSENEITFYQENFIDIIVNDKTIHLDKSMFADIYKNDNQTYHSGFGNTYIDKIDKENRKIIFTTFFGFHQSDHGELLYYSVSFDGKYEFIKVEVPKLGFAEDDVMKTNP